MAKPSLGAIYHVCDDEPAAPAELIAYGVALLGMTPPPLEQFALEEPALSEMVRGFNGDRMNCELSATLAHRTYREALKGHVDAN